MTKILQIVWVLLTVIFFGSGCTPKLPLPTDPVDVTGSFSTSGTETLESRWWTSFNDETLNRLIEKTHQDNFTLLVAWNRLDQAEAVARKSRAGLFPTLNAEAGAANSRVKSAGVITDSDTFKLGLAASYEVDLWGRVRSENQANEFASLATAEDLRTAYLTVTAEVATIWYQLVEQYGQQKIVEQQLETNRQTLELINLQFRTGRIGIADLLQQRQLVERNRGELAQIEARITILEHQLAILLAVQPNSLTDLDPTPFANLPQLPTTGLKVDLLDRRPDIRAAWYAVLSANQNTRSAIADRFPRLSLSASSNTEADNTSDLFDDWIASLAANLLGPVIDGGRRRAEVDRNRALTEENINRYGLKVLEAITEVEDALVREQQQLQYLDSLEKQLQLAESATERIRDRYTKGAEDYQRVLGSVLSQQNLQRSVLTARRELYEYRIALYRSLGGSWDIQKPTQTIYSSR